MDENVPLAITEGLRLRGIDVLTVQEDGLTSAPDPVVSKRAITLQRIVFSMDQDFLAEVKRLQGDGVEFSGVVFARQLAVSIGDCVRDLEIIVKVGSPKDFANQVQYLPF
jgi:hypothetical protein